MYEKILVPLDGSALAEEAIPHAEDIARRMGSEIVLLRVSSPVQTTIASDGTAVMADYLENEVRQVEVELTAYLSRVAARLRHAGVEACTAVKFGDAAEQIVDYAEAHGVGLIAMSTHGRTGLSRWVYGSVASRVLQAAAVPVLLIRSKPHQ